MGARCWGGHVYEVTPTELTLPARVHPPRVAGPLARPRPPQAMSSLLTETPGWKMCLRIAQKGVADLKVAMANDPRWVKDINIDAVVVAFTNLLTVISGIAPVTKGFRARPGTGATRRTGAGSGTVLGMSGCAASLPGATIYGRRFLRRNAKPARRIPVGTACTVAQLCSVL